MGDLTLYKDNDEGNTVISNTFIDCYMADANDAQIKVYLYLLRMTHANKATSISDLADRFNYTEKDICRSLRYWEQKGLLTLDYDTNGNLNAIRLLPVRSKYASSEDTAALLHPGSVMTQDMPDTPIRSDAFTPFIALMPEGIKPVFSDPAQLPERESAFCPDPSSIKKNYSLDDLKSFKNRESTAQVLFIAEQYLKKTLSANDIRSILFITDALHFSDDLIDYLLQYCVQCGKKDFRYIEKVAISWADNHITTPKEARTYTSRYDKDIYTVMNALGKTSYPTPKEIDYIKRWSSDYGFSQDIILEACSRTVLATDKHRFEYADKILENWKNAGIRTKSDIASIDTNYRRQKNAVSKKTTKNMFNQFQQNDYDFHAIEQKLLDRR